MLILFSGCASSTDQPRDFAIAPGQYPTAFNATRDVLLDLDFDLERVDAAAGVISTAPHFSQGLLEPWDATQSGLDQEWEDAVNRQAREVRVTFEQPEAAPTDPEAPAPLKGSVRVTIYRQHRAGVRLDSALVHGTTRTVDPDLVARHGSVYLVPLRRDERLESRIAARITQRLQPDGE